jgi:hypothetical protein
LLRGFPMDREGVIWGTPGPQDQAYIHMSTGSTGSGLHVHREII